jgi:hypothetical protein
MDLKRGGLLAIGLAIALAGRAGGQTGSPRGGYSYVREVSGEVTVDSRWNGQVQAARNMPISVGDEVNVSSGGRTEIGLADGNILYLGGGTRAAFASLRNQQGESDDTSLVRLDEGSLILAAVGSNENAIPRIDTEDASTYLTPGARARINYDPNRGTVVIARAGTAEVRTRDGRHQVRAGEYLMVRGEEEPEIERGAFSRDRFDIWAADRYESAFETQSASAQYVDENASVDVGAMDGYGDWSYNDTYGTNVWTPQVAAGWSPYSNGSWYYTPAGLTWWSYDPWGWYPFHYGNWFFNSGSWCWAPASVYSPAWVYWGYSQGIVGWCPVGYYSFYSPWCATYYRNWGWTGRGGVYLSVHGTFPARTVDFRGWNFAGSGGLTTAGRMEVIPGSRMAGRMGTTVAISSRPIVVTARPGEARAAVANFVKEAPRTIERTASEDSARLAPVLARERTLPRDTVDALHNRGVVADRGRLAGPGVADIAPRGALVDRARSIEMGGAYAGGGSRTGMTPDRGRSPSGAREAPSSGDGIARSAPNRVEPHTIVRGNESGVRSVPPSGDRASETWRGTSRSGESGGSSARLGQDLGTRTIERGTETSSAPRQNASQADWRGRGRSGVPRPDLQTLPTQRSSEDWRSRSSLPPARRVIEGSVPGRSSDVGGGLVQRSDGRWRDGPGRTEPRDMSSGRWRDYRPPVSAPAREMAPAPRNAPAPRSAPAAPHTAPAPHAAPHTAAPAPPHHGRD